MARTSAAPDPLHIHLVALWASRQDGGLKETGAVLGATSVGVLMHSHGGSAGLCPSHSSGQGSETPPNMPHWRER